jgi:hypothetical protein
MSRYLLCHRARILHEAFYSERRKHGIFGSILQVRTSTALATKFRAICGLGRGLYACRQTEHGDGNSRVGIEYSIEATRFFPP